MSAPRACVACGAVEPAGGLRLGIVGGGAEYEWFCRRAVACAERCAARIVERVPAGSYDPNACEVCGRFDGLHDRDGCFK